MVRACKHVAKRSMECLKGAIISRILKELDAFIDKDILKNYHPVSNLLFLEKLIERIVSIRLNKHMTENNLHSQHQYGYKQGHSTEMLLLKVFNDLLIACDEKKPTILMLLDLSAAFNTVNHSMLLTILHNEIGIVGFAFKWFKSFLIGRTQKVKVGNSYETKLPFGVAQGSVLGPVLFNIYIRSLYGYIKPAKFDTYGFADDHQHLKTFFPILQINALEGDLTRRFEMISKWMYKYYLCLNSSKTKILVIAPPTVQKKIVLHGTFINDECIRFVTSAKNLEIILDNELCFSYQIAQVVKSCFCIIRELSKIKSFLMYEHLRTLVSACIFSKINYCNSLYYGINAQLQNKLQSVQNCAAKLIRSKAPQLNLSIDACLIKCHWLLVRERIIFKILLTVHKCLGGSAPTALSLSLIFWTIAPLLEQEN